MNPHRKVVELRSSQHTTEDGALQKGEDFIRAFNLGFEVDDAIALLRMDDIYSRCCCYRVDELSTNIYTSRDVRDQGCETGDGQGRTEPCQYVSAILMTCITLLTMFPPSQSVE